MKCTRVTRITTSQPVPVFDLTVPGTENFALAAGVFVHNSKDVADAVCGTIFAIRQSRIVRAAHITQTEAGQTIRQGGERRDPGPRPE